MNHSFNADMMKLDIVKYKSSCNQQRGRDENRTLELGNSVQEEEKGVTKTCGFQEFSV